MVAYPRKGATLPAHTFLAELKRRKVFRAGAIYIASAFVVLQAADLLLPALHLPAWLMTLTVVVALLGLPLTLVLAWAFDVVPGTATVDDAAGVQTTGRASGVRWVVALFALVVLVTAGRFAWQRIVNPQESISTIAVLPFVNIGGVASDDYFSDGMTDELAHALIHLPGLRVAGRSSSYTFKGKEATAQAVGAALGVGALITGTVRRAGDRLRVTTQLVSTADGKILWDGQYETRSNDVFFVQDQFTREIISALSPTLTTQVADTLAGRVRGTRDQEAYELYLKGNYYWVERGKDNLARAIAHYRQAIGRDPSFARAYAGLALAYSVLPAYVVGAADSTTALLMHNAERALALDSTVADAHLPLGLGLELQARFAEAQQQYRAAIALEPSNVTAHHWLGINLLSVGKTEEALVEVRRATQLDALAKSPGSSLAMALVHARRFDEAEAQARQVLALDSTFPLALRMLGKVQIFAGKPDSAVRTLEHLSLLYPEAPGRRFELLFAYAAAGRWVDAERIRTELRSPYGDPSGGVEPALAELVFGNREPMIRMLTTDSGKQQYLRYSLVLGCDPLFDPLWADSRFRESMRNSGVAPCTLARPWALPPRPAGITER